jgi:hypothetical protein
MLKTTHPILTGAILAASGPALALAETPAGAGVETPALCAPYRAHESYLAARFGEHPVFTGQIEGGLVLRIMANSASGTWTMLVVRADGTACVRAAGEAGQREAGI